MLESLARIQWSALTDLQRIDLVRVYGLAFLRMGAPTPEAAKAIIGRLDPIFPAGTRELNAELSKLMIYLQAPTAAAKTVGLLAKGTTQEEQMDYAYSLRVLKTGWTPALQREYFQWFLKAANYRGGHSFAGFVRNIRADAEKNLSDSDRVTLKSVLDAKPVKKTPMEVLSSGVLAGRTTSKDWKMEDFVSVLDKPLKGRDFNRGRLMFSGTACTACHRFNNEGGSYGPDLSGVVGRFSARDLLESILLPNKEVSDQYAPVVIQRTEGDMVVGRVVNMGGDSITISPNMFDPDELVNVNRKTIVSIEPSKVSMMPAGLVNSLTQDEILDVVAYLLSRGDAAHPMFRAR